MPGIQSHPRVQRKVGPSMAVMPPFFPMPVAMVCSIGSPGCGCGATNTARVALWPAFTRDEMSNFPRVKAPVIAPAFVPLTQTSAW